MSVILHMEPGFSKVAVVGISTSLPTTGRYQALGSLTTNKNTPRNSYSLSLSPPSPSSKTHYTRGALAS
jgi:hypothetical protein